MYSLSNLLWVNTIPMPYHYYFCGFGGCGMRGACQSHTSLAPEQQRAIEILRSSNCKPQNIQLTLGLITTGKTAFSADIVGTKDLPKENYWNWNQSRKRQILQLDQETKPCFYKVSTKVKRDYNTPNPRFKVWVFNIFSPVGASTFLWCERGNPTSDSDLSVHQLPAYDGKKALFTVKTDKHTTPLDRNIPPDPWELEIPNDGSYFPFFPNVKPKAIS